MSDERLGIVIAGHVDHGKSTLVGRLLHDTGTLPDGKVEQVAEMSRRRGVPFEWSFVLDALQAERDQGITIDTTQVHFRTPRRRVVIIDAPGHTEFLKNMVTGAAAADAALLLVDVDEGAMQQSRRHAYLLHLLGIRQVAVVVNKMDRVGFDPVRFGAVADEMRAYLDELGIRPAAIIPVSARQGDNLASRSAEARWYAGPTVIEALDGFEPRRSAAELPLRFPVQDVYRQGDRRILAGRVESGRLRVGDELRFEPTGTAARIASIEAWNSPHPVLSASAGQSIGITLDRPAYVDRGHLAHREGEAAPTAANRIRVRAFWLGAEPLSPGRTYGLRVATAEHRVTVERVESVVDIDDLSLGPADRVRRNEIAEVVLRSRSPVPVDLAADLVATGRGVLTDGDDVVGGCLVIGAEAGSANLFSVGHAVTPEERASVNGHRGGVIWLTGLSGAGKSTLALAAERALFAQGRQVFVLDGDDLRRGISAGLGFSAEDRAENVRRAAEAAKLFVEAGVLVVVALISPLRSDRETARRVLGDAFSEVWVRADLEACEARDPKGLYRRARAGEIPEFTGVSAPYEEPESPDLVVDTVRLSRDEALELLVAHVEGRFGTKAGLGPFQAGAGI